MKTPTCPNCYKEFLTEGQLDYHIDNDGCLPPDDEDFESVELTDDEFEKYKMLDLHAEIACAMEHIEKCRLALQRLTKEIESHAPRT